MKVAVWDTYVTRADGVVMNFDIIVPESITDEETIFGYGKAYLKSRGMHDYPLTASQCSFCHIEKANEHVVASIEAKGYHILELRNC
ncbi:MAG: DUF2024 family protein [Cyclobacteriaceae bacterium]|nr:DUF2024 family protein [Cyclobacteriaceae bacterium]